jgi:hypothetical protein
MLAPRNQRKGWEILAASTRGWLAPPRFERPFGLQEWETLACRTREMAQGKTIGEDRESAHEAFRKVGLSSFFEHVQAAYLRAADMNLPLEFPAFSHVRA